MDRPIDEQTIEWINMPSHKDAINASDNDDFAISTKALRLDRQVNCRTLAEEENVFEPLLFLKYLLNPCDFYTKRFGLQNRFH